MLTHHALHAVERLAVRRHAQAVPLRPARRAGLRATEQGVHVSEQLLDLVGLIQNKVAVRAQLGFLIPQQLPLGRADKHGNGARGQINHQWAEHHAARLGMLQPQVQDHQVRLHVADKGIGARALRPPQHRIARGGQHRVEQILDGSVILHDDNAGTGRRLAVQGRSSCPRGGRRTWCSAPAVYRSAGRGMARQHVLVHALLRSDAPTWDRRQAWMTHRFHPQS